MITYTVNQILPIGIRLENIDTWNIDSWHHQPITVLREVSQLEYVSDIENDFGIDEVKLSLEDLKDFINNGNIIRFYEILTD